MFHYQMNMASKTLMFYTSKCGLLIGSHSTAIALMQQQHD